MNRRGLILVAVMLLTGTTGCSIRGYAINMIGNSLAEGGSSFESDDDVELVGDALPFTLKLTEILLEASPRNRGLLQTAARLSTAYSYAYVHWEADKTEEADLGEARRMRARAIRLYLRGYGYGMRGLEEAHEGFGQLFSSDPVPAARALGESDLELIYWTAAALGLAISADPDEPRLLVRLDEVEALLDRALELDEGWEDGALHEFAVVFAAARPGAPDYEEIRRHFDRADALSEGRHAGLYVAYAESVAVSRQDSMLFRSMLERAMAIDPDEHVEIRLANLIAQERARWLLERTDDLIFDLEVPEGELP
jgi:predicted anti-sigma-YlaC factor YlaD